MIFDSTQFAIALPIVVRQQIEAAPHGIAAVTRALAAIKGGLGHLQVALEEEYFRAVPAALAAGPNPDLAGFMAWIRTNWSNVFAVLSAVGASALEVAPPTAPVVIDAPAEPAPTVPTPSAPAGEDEPRPDPTTVV